jgi:hypothetical protein
MKKILMMLLMTAAAAMSSGAETLLFAQNGQGPDNVWSNGANWFSALHAPTTNDTARILGDSTWKPAVVTAPGAVAGTVEMGLFQHGGVLTIDPAGTLAVSQNITIGQSLPDAGRENLLVNNGELTVAGQGIVQEGVSVFENNGTATFNGTPNSFVMRPTGLGTVTNNGEFYAAGTVYASHSGNAVFVNETSGTFTNGNTVIMGQVVGAIGLLVNKGNFTAGNILYMNNGDQTLVNEGTMTLPTLTCQGDSSTAIITNSGTLTVSGNITLAVGGHTVFNMEGGTVTANTMIMVPGGEGDSWTNNSVHLNLNGGTIDVGNLNLNGDKLANSTIDITEGVLIDSGDKVAKWNFVVAEGAATAYGGGGIVIVEYDGTNTIVRGALANYATWADSWGVDIGSEKNDYDGDWVDNLGEYGIDGDPTNSADQGQTSTAIDGANLVYVHAQRSDDQSLSFWLETTASLTIPNWSNSGYTVVATNVTGGVYDFVTNTVPTAADETFIRLRVQNN